MRYFLINALGIAGASVGLFLGTTQSEVGLVVLSMALLFVVAMPKQRT